MVQNNRGSYRSGGGGAGGSGPTDPHKIGEHTDVQITAPQNDDVLKYQTADGTWRNFPSSVVLADLDDLANVDTTGKNDFDILYWNLISGNWETADAGKVARFINKIGLDAGKGAANQANQGTTYFSTDVDGGTLYESDGAQWVQIAKGLALGFDPTDLGANEMLAGDGAGSPIQPTIGADELVGRAGATDITGLTKAQVLSIINVTEGAQPTGPLEVDAAGAVMESDYIAQSVLISVAPGAPAPVAVLNGQLIGRGATGDLKALSKAEILAVLNVEDGAEVNQTDAEILAQLSNVDGHGSGLDADTVDGQHASEFAADVHTHGEGDITGLPGKYVPNALFNANTILKANIDDIPTPLVVGEDRVVGRLAGGAIEPLTGPQLGSLIRLNDLAAPSASYDMNSKTLTSLLAPSNDTDAARWADTWAFRNVREITGPTQDTEVTDAGMMLRFNLGSPQTYTVQPNSSIPFPVGTRIALYVQHATGSLTVAAGAGVTIHADQLTLTPGDSALLVKTVAPDQWLMTTTQSAQEGVPAGGNLNDVLTKNSGNDFDTVWAPPAGGGGGDVPDGGTTGQHLAKQSNTNQDTIWEDPPTFTSPVPTDGTAGQILAKASAAVHDMEWIDDIGSQTDLTNTPTPTDVTVESSDGLDTTIAGASQTLAGVQSAADKTKLDGLDDAAQLPPGGATGTVLKKTSGADYDTEWGAAADTPLTTKGDLLGYDTGDNRVPVGTDDQVLTADSTQPLGVAWKTPAGGGGSPLTTKGDLFTFDTADQRLGVGTDGQVLEADSSEPTGLKWATPSGGGGGSGLSIPVTVQTGNTYTFLQGDADAQHQWNETDPVVVTIPENLTAPWGAEVRARGAGQVIFVVENAANQTIESPFLGVSGGSSASISHQHGTVRVLVEDSTPGAIRISIAGWDTPEPEIPQPIPILEPTGIASNRLGVPGSNGTIARLAMSQVADEVKYRQIFVRSPINIDEVEIRVNASGTATTMHWAVYSVTGNLPGDLVGGASFDVSTGGIKNDSAGLYLPRGHYYLADVFDGTVTLEGAKCAMVDQHGEQLDGVNYGRDLAYLTASMTAGALPDPAPTPTGGAGESGTWHIMRLGMVNA